MRAASLALATQPYALPGATPCYPTPPPEVFLWEEDAWIAAATQIKKANPNTPEFWSFVCPGTPTR